MEKILSALPGEHRHARGLMADVAPRKWLGICYYWIVNGAPLFAFAMIMILATAVLGADSVNIKLSGVRYIVSYTEPIGDGPAKIDITFYRVKPSPYRTEQILAANITSSVSVYPENDIVGTAWYSSSGDDGDTKILPVKDGSFHLSYSAMEKQLMPWGQYMSKYGKKEGDK